MNLQKCFLAICVCCLSVAVNANECKLVSRSNDVALMQCSKDAHQDRWVASAKAICLDDSRCNVWIWSTDVQLPQQAPDTDIELPKSLTSQAIAVWANDTATLLQLKKKTP